MRTLTKPILAVFGIIVVSFILLSLDGGITGFGVIEGLDPENTNPAASRSSTFNNILTETTVKQLGDFTVLTESTSGTIIGVKSQFGPEYKKTNDYEILSDENGVPWITFKGKTKTFEVSGKKVEQRYNTKAAPSKTEQQTATEIKIGDNFVTVSKQDAAFIKKNIDKVNSSDNQYTIYKDDKKKTIDRIVTTDPKTGEIVREEKDFITVAFDIDGEDPVSDVFTSQYGGQIPQTVVKNGLTTTYKLSGSPKDPEVFITKDLGDGNRKETWIHNVGGKQTSEEVTFDKFGRVNMDSLKITGDSKYAEQRKEEYTKHNTKVEKQIQKWKEALEKADVEYEQFTSKFGTMSSSQIGKNDFSWSGTSSGGKSFTVSSTYMDDDTMYVDVGGNKYKIEDGVVTNTYYRCNDEGKCTKTSRKNFEKETGLTGKDIDQIEDGTDEASGIAKAKCRYEHGNECMTEIAAAREQYWQQLESKTRGQISEVLGAYLSDILGPPDVALSYICGDRMYRTDTEYKPNKQGIPVPSSTWKTEKEIEFYEDLRTSIVFGEVTEITSSLYRYEATIKIIGDEATPEWELYFKNSCDGETSKEIWKEYGQVGNGQVFQMLYAGTSDDDMVFDCEEDSACRFDEVCLAFKDESTAKCVELAGTMSSICND